MLTTASVQGELFTVQIVAKLMQVDERFLLRSLSQELDRQHRLIREENTERVGNVRLTRFRFCHDQIRQYLYEPLAPVSES